MTPAPVMMRLSEAAHAVGAEVRGSDVAFSSVSQDSRSLASGALFVALRGERFDGHQFLARAAQQGAVAALVDEAAGLRIEDRGSRGGLPLLVVSDTRKALGLLGKYWRAKFQISLIALTGSSGKTTVKEMLALVLRDACAVEPPQSSVLATRGNLNNDIGVPLMLLELRPHHRYAVIEMGMNHAGEIAWLTSLARPDVALVINAGRAHLEGLGSKEAVARAKGEIFEGLTPDGVAVINADDRFAALWRELAGQHRVVTFGVDAPADIAATYALSGVASQIVMTTPLGTAPSALQVPGLHNVRNALAAAAAASALEIDPQVIAAGLARFAGVKGRLQTKRALHGATLIDDTYNANPDSVCAAISVLAAAPGVRLMVLGDMGELGATAPELHAEIGTFARAAGIDQLFTLGELSQQAARTFGTGARHFPRIEELLAEIENRLAPDVTMLIKGSRFMHMERVVQSFEVGGEE